ncbi:MAG: DUF1501 domain-containing protein [Ignavibacteria bacterium]|nr:DUF1501 domain-containing protein [Ignavibacteria bacterium]
MKTSDKKNKDISGHCGCKDHKDEVELSRRKFISLGMALSAGVIFSKFGYAKHIASKHPELSFMNPLNAKAERVIVLWLAGAPSQFETFSPKPKSKNGGSTKAIQTNSTGIELAENLPQLAMQMDKITLIRTLTSKEGNHSRASYLMHTSYSPTGVVKNPSFGAITAKELGGAKEFDLPYFISLNGPSYSAEFLGKEYSPYIIKDVNKPLENITKFKDVDDGRFSERLKLLNEMENNFYSEKGLEDIKERQIIYDKTVKMMNSPLIKAFDISEESDVLKKAYGENDFGKGCLMARRLVEAGVKFVEVTLDGWDTHQDNFNRTANLCKTLDPAFSTLLEDLKQKGMLESTLVLCMGEFGRTPAINANEGRDHYPDAFACAIAGGGVRGGRIYGETNDDGNQIISNPVTPGNLFATLSHQLGIDYNKVIYSPQGRPLKYVNEGSVIEELVN